MSEVKEIMDVLGRGQKDGEVKSTHLGQILTYLQITKKEPKKITLSKLALICGMAVRQLRENYFDGLEAFGIINVNIDKNTECWSWIGITALNGEIIIKEETATEYISRKNKEKEDKDSPKNNLKEKKE